MFAVVESQKAERILDKTVTVQTKTPHRDIYLLSGFMWASSLLLLLLVCTVFVLLFLNVIYMLLLLSLQAAVNRTVNWMSEMTAALYNSWGTCSQEVNTFLFPFDKCDTFFLCRFALHVIHNVITFPPG